ncbi:MAG TPA: glutaredoxin family protein [Firmicutes bacterium]|uniref:Glutaredoxin family protein n=1 Tax=Candidatus Fermentithermobacillus carboniphilus TaxID=3085328 RepID=A0AAT9LHG4_9FIRM|nr:MAG: glutaredoxin family protein [Candidatus Fermentithermobacillus carboniphilus]HHW18908.1 glutaredoxin family protein [Candidatus Fermentithermobacillaceae bacterium]
MANHEVTVYSTPTCPWCTRAKSYLKELGIPFEEKDVSVDIQAAREMVRISGQMGVPVLVIDGNVVVGFDKRRIDQLLSDSV